MSILDSRYLTHIRLEALRRRIWFKALSSLERALIDLVIRVVDKPKSPTLIDILARIIVKIKKAMMSPLKQIMEQIGRPLAKKISVIAMRWGNKSAAKWAEDESFIRYLAIMEMNSPPGFRLSEMLLKN
ncbi:MAG: hypothetical protein NZ940_07675 [Candidatus Nezhaarchaeota archaeon]|nr:hypothetical protein [Candidatus Nezhaarchaeota archaeon]